MKPIEAKLFKQKRESLNQRLKYHGTLAALTADEHRFLIIAGALAILTDKRGGARTRKPMNAKTACS